METLKHIAVKSDNELRAKINKHFIILWRKRGDKKFRLIGAGRYHTVVGEHYRDKHFEKVLKDTKRLYKFNIRHKFDIHFRAK